MGGSAGNGVHAAPCAILQSVPRALFWECVNLCLCCCSVVEVLGRVVLTLFIQPIAGAYCALCTYCWCLLCSLYTLLVLTLFFVHIAGAYFVFTTHCWCLLCSLYKLLVLTLLFVHIAERVSRAVVIV